MSTGRTAMEMSTRTQGIVGVLKATTGPTSLQSNRLVKKMVDAGNLIEVRWALANVLLGQGMAEGKIPHNTGNLNRELQELCIQGAEIIVLAYRDAGGFLLAKGYCSEHEMVQEMLTQWTKGFASPIPVSVRLADNVDPEEFNARFSLAVQLSMKVLIAETEKSGTKCIYKSGQVYGFAEEYLESVVRKVVRSTLRAFEAPNEVNHELVHGTPQPQSE
jgi:hypothetical protein